MTSEPASLDKPSQRESPRNVEVTLSASKALGCTLSDGNETYVRLSLILAINAH